jgi:hypothetical protein
MRRSDAACTLIKMVKAEINMEILYSRKRNCLISKKY